MFRLFRFLIPILISLALKRWSERRVAEQEKQRLVSQRAA